MKIDKAKLKGDNGGYLTQGLFIEYGDPEVAIYTLKDEDVVKEGKKYYSLAKLFMACDDPTYYQFASTYLYNWKHWLRLRNNKLFTTYFEELETEHEVMTRSNGVRGVLDAAASDSNAFTANKWLADKGWDKRAAGRPSKKEKKHEQVIQQKMEDEFSSDAKRLFN